MGRPTSRAAVGKPDGLIADAVASAQSAHNQPTISLVQTLRVASYSVRAATDGTVAAVRAARPDLLLLRHAPSSVRWRTRGAALARRSGLVLVTGGAPAAGNLLLCSLRLEVEQTLLRRWGSGVALDRRGLALAVFRLGTVRFAAAAVEFGHERDRRYQQIGELQGLLAEIAPGLPTVIAGDLPTGPAWSDWTRLPPDGCASGGILTAPAVISGHALPLPRAAAGRNARCPVLANVELAG